MSEDEEDYDELPPITVNSSTRDSSSFSMPRASELAEQRAREERCELELRRMRELAPAPAPPAHSDSSGSEGEAALAAAVSALRVRAAAAPAAPRLAALLGAAAPRLPPAPFIDRYLRAAARAAGRPRRLDDLNEEILSCIIRMEPPWEEGAVEAAGAWLCAALAAAEGRRLGPRLARAAHRLLDEAAADAHVAALAGALCAALPAAQARLHLSDALRGGGASAGAARLADRLRAAARADLLRAEEGAERAWRRMDARDQYVALQLAARAHAHAPAPAAACAPAPALLHALLSAAPPARDQRPDALKVLVAASKLRVLFQANK